MTRRLMPRTVNLLSPYKFISQDTLHGGHEHNGFRDRECAEYWRERSCGIACAQMLLYAQHGHIIPAGRLIEDGVAIGAYRKGVGWTHSGLAALLTKQGVPAIARLLLAEDLMYHLVLGGAAILSVTPTLGVKRQPPKLPSARGGHLILCHGFCVPLNPAEPCTPLSKLLISDPDHDFPDRLEGTLTSFDLVARAWSGRCIAISPMRHYINQNGN